MTDFVPAPTPYLPVGQPFDPPLNTPAPVPQPPPKVRVKVEPVPLSRLDTLLYEYASASARAAAAKDEAETLQEAIRAELEAGYEPESLPDGFDIPAHPQGAYPGYRYTYVPGGWAVDSQRMKSEDPETYVRFAKRKRGYWQFAEATQQGRGRRR